MQGLTLGSIGINLASLSYWTETHTPYTLSCNPATMLQIPPAAAHFQCGLHIF